MPRQLALLLIVLIPKPDGGERPIGVFPMVLRAIDRWYRWHYGADWLKRQPTGAHYGLKGSTVEDAVWRQALLGEWSAAVGMAAATFLLDIGKAFEHIRHDRLWVFAKK